MKRLLVLLCVAWPALAHAQPVPVTWRPPVTCSTNDFLKWSGTAWVCSGGAAVLSGAITNNVIPKGSSGNLADSSITDDATNIKLGGNNHPYTSTRNISCAYGTNATEVCLLNQVGYQNGVTQFRDLAVYDGKNAEVAYFTGSTKAFRVNGNTTLGDTPASDTTTINGNTTINGKGAGTTALSVSGPGSGGGTAGLFAGAGYDNAIAITGTPADQIVVTDDTTPTFDFNNASDTTLAILNGGAGVANVTVDGAFSAAGSINSTGSFMQAAQGVYAYTGYTYLLSGQLNFGYNANATYTGKINAVGYGEGTTQFRNLEIDDGKGAAVALFTGSDKSTLLSGTIQATRVLSETQLDDYTRGFEIYSEFLNVPTSATLTGGGVGAFDNGFSFYGGFAGTNAESNRPGLLTLRAYTSTDTIGGSPAPRYARIITGAGAVGDSWFAGGGAARFAGAFEILGFLSPPVDDSDSYTVHIGLYDDNTTNGATADYPPNGIYCRVGSASSNVQVCTAEADTQSCTDTSPAIAIAEDHWYKCEFSVNAGATQVDFTVTDVTAASSGTASRTTNIPNDSSHPVGVGATVDSIDAAGTGAIYVDYLWFDQTFTTAR